MSKPCSHCGKPRDRGKQRLCKACHRDSMQRWREAHEYIAKPATFHMKPFVNSFPNRDRFEVREEDGAFIILIEGNPMSLDPPIEDREEAEGIVDALSRRIAAAIVPVPVRVGVRP